MNWQTFFDMGGYAAYVWPAWGITAIALLGLYVNTKWQNQRIKQLIRRQVRRQVSREDRVNSKNASS